MKPLYSVVKGEPNPSSSKDSW